MLKIILIQPGATDFDDQRRIKGSLDMPLNENGTDQAQRTALDLESTPMDRIYAAPGQSAMQTAEAIAADRGLKVKSLKNLHNLDHGLWHGKLVDEVRRGQPRVYRQWQEHNDNMCPPGGETIAAARERVRQALIRLLKRHKSGTIAIVVSEPLATLARNLLNHSELGDLWQSEHDSAAWQLLEIEPADVALSP